MKYTEKGSNCPDKYTKLFRGIITTIVISSASVLYAQELSFSAIDGAPLSLHPISVTPEKNTGLNQIYVLYSTEDVVVSFPSATAKWYRYSNLGGGFAEEIDTESDYGSDISKTSLVANSGYIIEAGSSRYYFWVVDYGEQRFSVSSVSSSEKSDCDMTVLDVECKASPIYYYTINGQQRVLDREIEVVYDNQEWNQESKAFEIHTVVKTVESISDGQLTLMPPLYCSTAVSVCGDRFLKEWKWEESAESSVIDPVAVQVQAVAIQEGTEISGNTGESDNPENPDASEAEPEGSNQINSGIEGLGGSAPASISFNAMVTQGVIHHEWQFSRDPEFNEIEYRFNQQDLDYTFNEEGTFYLRYIGSNYDGSCTAGSETFTVNIGASELLCPNAFSPNEDGVNDQWKVSYRSIIEFDCWIFDRNGHEIIHLTSPDQGWDGKRHGKYVKSGVYYYVIRAKGADGHEYKKSGDINIIRHSRVTNSGDSTSASDTNK